MPKRRDSEICSTYLCAQHRHNWSVHGTGRRNCTISPYGLGVDMKEEFHPGIQASKLLLRCSMLSNQFKKAQEWHWDKQQGLSLAPGIRNPGAASTTTDREEKQPSLSKTIGNTQYQDCCTPTQCATPSIAALTCSFRHIHTGDKWEEMKEATKRDQCWRCMCLFLFHLPQQVLRVSALSRGSANGEKQINGAVTFQQTLKGAFSWKVIHFPLSLSCCYDVVY